MGPPWSGWGFGHPGSPRGVVMTRGVFFLVFISGARRSSIRAPPQYITKDIIKPGG